MKVNESIIIMAMAPVIFISMFWASSTFLPMERGDCPSETVPAVQPEITFPVASIDKRLLTVTAYLCVDEKENRYHGITRSGEPCVPNVSAAVDPTVIPLGSAVYIPAMKRWFIAVDTGNMIKNHTLDIAVASRNEAAAFGRKTMEIITVVP